MQQILIAYLVLRIFFCHGENQLMVCKPVNSIFETKRANLTSLGCSSSVGKPGKQGARGLRGPLGPPGPPGVVDYEQLNSLLQTELNEIKKKLQCIDGVIIGNTCYKLLYQTGLSVDFERARSLCAFHGGGLPEVPDSNTYDVLFNYVKANWYIFVAESDQQSTFVHFWLGSSYDGRGNVILTSGQRGFVRWYPNHPIAQTRRTHLGFRVPIQPQDSTQGIFNIYPSHNVRYAPLCQFQLL